MPFNAGLFDPLQHGVAGQLGAIAHCGIAAG
jgi:hypothetical protein